MLFSGADVLEASIISDDFSFSRSKPCPMSQCQPPAILRTLSINAEQAAQELGP